MKTPYLPKLAVAILAASVCVICLSGQVGQVAATPSTWDWCYPYQGYYNMSYYWYQYGYSNYCYYGYYGHYGYPYYNYGTYGYPYYYGYWYNGYPYYTPPLVKYRLTVSTDPANITSISGSGTYDQGTSASFSIAQTDVQISPTARYVFSHWSGDYSGVGTSGSVTMNGARKIIAVYQLQYFLSVGTQPQSVPLPQGQGWYNAGDTVTLTVDSQMLGGDGGSRSVFEGWNIDGKTLQPGVALTLKMDSPHTVTAQYKQQYYLKVLTDQGVAYGEGWYDDGATAEIYASTPVSTSYGVSIIFNGWQGDLQSGSQSATVLMDGPKTAIASWRTDATVLDLTVALGLVALFLVAAGIIAYVAINRNRFARQAEKERRSAETV